MENKTWFLKRWIISLVDWLDVKLFASKVIGESPSLAPLFWRNLSVCFIAACVIAICSLFLRHDTEQLVLNIFMAILGLFTLVTAILFLRYSLPTFPTTLLKIGRSVYVVIMLSIAMFLGITAAMWAIFIVVALLVISFLWWMCFGDAGRKRESA